MIREMNRFDEQLSELEDGLQRVVYQVQSLHVCLDSMSTYIGDLVEHQSVVVAHLRKSITEVQKMEEDEQ